MPEVGPEVVRRRAASIWTLVHPLFAIGQLLAFVVSVGLLVAFALHAVPFHAVHISVLVKIGLMLGAVITGSLWEHDVYGYWWFAPEFLAEDVMTLIVFITQLGYLFVAYAHPDRVDAIVSILCAAYAIYLANVAQYIHKTQRMKQATRAESLRRAA